ncbi:hypothetical protein FSB78_06095 [Sphingomonas ginsenosidivorax]|uniref:Permease n=1 Tax=Sphingomonas ginsenosidivorax TaxID=862135 RepID=A0A5C6UF37_9SPHN|nr:hypothetical protein [Sphingomonas ginsenosidivorax]TXC70558.1 hypothetical protein FSB78_06095 [Sphingomonas ginsenosidivorax]
MDFMKWLNSLDELLYEVMSWLLFFPVTMWRAAVHPIRILHETEAAAMLPEDQRYADVLSPPLFLALALLVAHAIATALGQTDLIIANQHGLAALVTDNASALVLRIVIFAAFPLFLAARMVRRQKAKLDRISLQQPFYGQCYPAAIFALGISTGASLGYDSHPLLQTIGHWLVVASIVNFWVVETLWFAKVLGIGYLRACGNVLVGLLEGTLFLLAVGFLFTR